MIHLLQNIYSHVKAKVKSKDGLTSSFVCNLGVRQGCTFKSVVICNVQLTLVVSNSVDSNFQLNRIFIEVPNFVVYKYI